MDRLCQVGKSECDKKSRNVSRTTSDGAIRTDKQKRYWKTILIVDDDADSTTAFKIGIEIANNSTNKRMQSMHTMIVR
jgi:hypothetical protein